uniref:Uncharacterized protein n=1 Tax=Arundo donax TaxID=35708 RepID=A0A0A9B366_ARUDO
MSFSEPVHQRRSIVCHICSEFCLVLDSS